MRMVLHSCLLSLALVLSVLASPAPPSLPSPDVDITVDCSQDYIHSSSSSSSCLPTICRRLIYDDFLSPPDVSLLLALAEKAISAGRPSVPRVPGPTIVDINSGYLRDSLGLVNMYSNAGSVDLASNLFSQSEYDFYRSVVDRIRATVSKGFSLPSSSSPYFTSPTFITRLVHEDDWQPKGMHDVYWMSHVDKNNTQHYDYSALLYLSTEGVDFTGGRFAFVTEKEPYETVTYDISPSAGRLVSFTAGMENTHRVQRVTGGTRYVLSFWFTCDVERSFDTFLDGQAHRYFGGKNNDEDEDDKDSSNDDRKGKGKDADSKGKRVETAGST